MYFVSLNIITELIQPYVTYCMSKKSSSILYCAYAMKIGQNLLDSQHMKLTKLKNIGRSGFGLAKILGSNGSDSKCAIIFFSTDSVPALTINTDSDPILTTR